MPASPLPPDRLYRRVDPAELPFRSTDQVPDLTDVIGQDRAVEALEFGIGIRQAARPHRPSQPVVEVVHEGGIAAEGVGRGDRLDIDLDPQAVAVAEGGKARFRRDAGAGQHHDLAEASHRLRPGAGPWARRPLP